MDLKKLEDLDRPKWFGRAFDAVDWRLTLYENGKVDYDDTIRAVVTAVTQIAGEDLANGERVEWCENHQTGPCAPHEAKVTRCFIGHAMNGMDTCRIVSKLLVDPPTKEDT